MNLYHYLNTCCRTTLGCSETEKKSTLKEIEFSKSLSQRNHFQSNQDLIFRKIVFTFWTFHTLHWQKTTTEISFRSKGNGGNCFLLSTMGYHTHMLDVCEYLQASVRTRIIPPWSHSSGGQTGLFAWSWFFLPTAWEHSQNVRSLKLRDNTTDLLNKEFLNVANK